MIGVWEVSVGYEISIGIDRGWFGLLVGDLWGRFGGLNIMF